MTLLQDLEALLIGEGIVQGDGIDVFIDNIPEAPDDLVGILEYPGLSTPKATRIVVRSVQFFVRNLVYEEGRSKINGIFGLVDTPEDRIKDITSERWGVVQSKSTPTKIGVDANGRHLFVLNVAITTYRD